MNGGNRGAGEGGELVQHLLPTTNELQRLGFVQVAAEFADIGAGHEAIGFTRQKHQRSWEILRQHCHLRRQFSHHLLGQ